MSADSDLEPIQSKKLGVGYQEAPPQRAVLSFISLGSS